jgi:hypothetical protein
MAAAACAADIDQTIPQSLFDNLENDAYGRDYLLDLDQQFAVFAQAQRGSATPPCVE